MAIEAQAPAGPSTDKGHAGRELDPLELLDQIQKCLEALFSKTNLAEDAFIQQHMNAQMYIPLCILASHHNIAKLGPGATIDTLLAAAHRSDRLGVDADNLLVRPISKQRNTLILHDLPEDVAEGDLRALFESCPEFTKLRELKPDVNRTAFVSFESDEAAQSTALWLRSQKLRGSAIPCAVKSEHALPSFFPAMPGTPLISMAAHSPPLQGGLPHWARPGKGLGNVSWPSSPWTGPQHWPSSAGWSGYDGPGESWGNGWEHGQEDFAMRDAKRGKGGAAGAAPDGQGPADADGAEMFAGGRPDAENDLDESELGYKHDFRKYTRERIIELCSGMEDVTKPESFARLEKDEACALLLRRSPCTDWAPLPAPALSLAASALAGEGRRGGAERGDDDGADAHDGSGPRSRRQSRPPRKHSSSSGTWAKDNQHDRGDWNDYDYSWDWRGADASAWAGGAERWRAPSRKRTSTSSSRPDWYGPTWQPKDREHAAGARQSSAERRPRSETAERVDTAAAGGKSSWVEKVKAKVRTSSEATADPPGDRADGPAAAGRAAPDAAAEESPAQQHPPVAEQTHAPSEQPEAAVKAPAAPQTWADRVRQRK